MPPQRPELRQDRRAVVPGRGEQLAPVMCRRRIEVFAEHRAEHRRHRSPRHAVDQHVAGIVLLVLGPQRIQQTPLGPQRRLQNGDGLAPDAVGVGQHDRVVGQAIDEMPDDVEHVEHVAPLRDAALWQAMGEREGDEPHVRTPQGGDDLGGGRVLDGPVAEQQQRHPGVVGASRQQAQGHASPVDELEVGRGGVAAGRRKGGRLGGGVQHQTGGDARRL